MTRNTILFHFGKINKIKKEAQILLLCLLADCRGSASIKNMSN